MAEDGAEPTDSFELLAHPTRMAVLRELFAAFRESPDDPEVRFSALRQRVDAPDSGNFSYHLDRLVGWFVDETDAGYRLSRRGYGVGLALESGRYGQSADPAPVESLGECLFCESPFDARFEDGHVVLRCANGHRSNVHLRPGTLDDRSVDELREIVALRLAQNAEQTLRGICSACDGRLDVTGVRHEDLDGYLFADRCSGCGAQFVLTAGMCALLDPDVSRFLRDRGRDPRTTPLWEFSVCRTGAETVASPDPLELRVDVECDGDRLSVSVDESGRVARVSRHR